MKRRLILLSTALVASLGWWLGSPSRGPATTTQHTQASAMFPAPSRTVTDPAVVFQKAFWKRPTAEDQVLHAERREWQDAAGISKWQWFISVKPSQALLQHLIRDNAFGLSTTRHVRGEATADLPAWFPREPAAGSQILTGSGGTFLVVWDPEKNTLHATDRGSGFRPGISRAPQPVASAAAPPAGRLPTTPPPRPGP